MVPVGVDSHVVAHIVDDVALAQPRREHVAIADEDVRQVPMRDYDDVYTSPPSRQICPFAAVVESPFASHVGPSAAIDVGDHVAALADIGAVGVIVDIVAVAVVEAHTNDTSSSAVASSIAPAVAAAPAARTSAQHPLPQARGGSCSFLLSSLAAGIRSPPFPVPTDSLSDPPPVLLIVVVASVWRGAADVGAMGTGLARGGVACARAGMREVTWRGLQADATHLTHTTAIVPVRREGMTSVDGCVGRRTSDATVSLTLNTVSSELRRPSRATIALRPASLACGAAMSPMGATLNRTRTQHRPQARAEPGTGAPCHTPRYPLPGTPTDLHLTVSPGGPHTHTDEDENGDARYVYMWLGVVPVMRAWMVMYGDTWHASVTCDVGVHTCGSGDLGNPSPTLTPSSAYSSLRAVLLLITSSIVTSIPPDIPPSIAVVYVCPSVEDSRKSDTYTSGFAVGANGDHICSSGCSGVPPLNLAGSIFV